MDDTLPPSKPARAGRADRVAPGADETGPLVAYPTEVGPYVVEAKIGEGGMGQVFRCFDPSLKRRVAVKILHDKYSADARYRARFRREGETIASLSHPAVAQVHAIDSTPDGALYLVMEYVDGCSVEDIVRTEGKLELDRAIRIVRAVALGLDTAYQKGVIHRDVKPSNILVGRDDSVKIVDFGLAKEIGAEASITDAGMVLGTPHYISPEQGRGKKVDHRSDLYSLGATFYHMVTGRTPFVGTSQVAIIVAHVEDEPPAPHELNPALPKSVSQVIGRMMASDPQDRFQDYRELVRDLDCIERGDQPFTSSDGGRFRPEPRRRWRTRVQIAVLFLILGIAGVVAGTLSTETVAGLEAREELRSWYLENAGGGDTLNMDFAQPPPSVSDPVASAFLIPSEGEQTVDPLLPAIRGGTLSWQDFTAPFACRYIFDRINEIRVNVVGQTGFLDLGVAIVDPQGNTRRQLLVRVRPDDTTADPVEALRNNERMAIHPDLPPLPRLVPPYSITLDLEPAGEDVQLNLKITRPDVLYPLYDHPARLEGNDWNRGVVVFKTSPRRRPFSISLERIVISGILSGSSAEEVPWQS